MTDTHLRVAIIGAGFGGLGTAIRLQQDGIDDFAVFERAETLGGTWQANTYPAPSATYPRSSTPSRSRPNPTGAGSTRCRKKSSST